MPNSYIFFGLSGSGKGTQAEILREHLEQSGDSVLYIETGKRFREVADRGDTYTSSLVKNTLESGGLLPEFLPIWAWTQMLYDSFSGNEHLIFDGVSRRIDEAPVLDGALSFYGMEKRYVFVLDVSHDVATERLLERGRSDDTPEDIRSRLSWYEKDVAPVLDYFANNDAYTFVRINGEGTRDEVRDRVLAAL